MKYAYLLISFLVVQKSFGDTIHELNLKPGQWTIKPALFYISNVVDERADKQNTGQALENNKPVPVKFRNSAESDLLIFLNSTVSRDTNLIPLILSIKKFEVNETGTTASHKATFRFQFEIYREINSKRYKLYETQGSPELTMKGPYENPHENNISESLKNVFTGFNEWLNKNPDLPPLARSAKVILSKAKTYSGDTLTWSESYKLTWADFKGTNPSGPFMAQSNCVFDYRVDPKMNNGILELHLNLGACFERNSSWVKKGAQTDGLLMHEQLHFDICELNIRKLRKKMLSMTILDPMAFDQQLKVVFEQGWNDYMREQQRYDDETQHGIVEKEQKRWEEEVALLLKNED